MLRYAQIIKLVFLFDVGRLRKEFTLIGKTEFQFLVLSYTQRSAAEAVRK
jgi:hypothetical protein